MTISTDTSQQTATQSEHTQSTEGNSAINVFFSVPPNTGGCSAHSTINQLFMWLFHRRETLDSPVQVFHRRHTQCDPQVDMGGANGVMASSRLMWEINLRRKVRACRKLRMIFSISFFTLSPTNMYFMWYLSMGQGHPG